MRIYLCILLAAACLHLTAQEKSPFHFSYSNKRLNDNEVQASILVTIEPGVKLYGLQNHPDDLLYSGLSFDSLLTQKIVGKTLETGHLLTERDSSVNGIVNYYTDSVVWQQKIHAGVADSFLLKGQMTLLYKKGNSYTPAEEKFRLFIHPAPNDTQMESVNTSYKKSLWSIFLTAFAGGLLALLTPCVYSMIPITIGFFTKRSNTRAGGIRNALLYAGSIIVIFTVIGFLVTLIFGPAALNNLATNWIANLVFFALFIIFGLSFLGAFDIRLPSAWTNMSDARASISSFSGIFFMALTLVLVSFSCTGPIIGNLLVLAARGNFFGPLTGMLGFSMAMALPFALFAFFPNKINILGKAGGWLNAVKVVLGFLELALALKFLSNADLVQKWHLLDREVFIVLWVVIFILLGFYLLGKLKFQHDDELPKNDFGVSYISAGRLVFAICALSFAVYMVPGLWGAPLKSVSAFLPPMGTQDFIVTKYRQDNNFISNESADGQLHPFKYEDKMSMYEPEAVSSLGLSIYFDYAEALAAAKVLKKPLMLDFTGINCVNCRKMEGQVWSNPDVIQKLKNDFIIVSLYVDANNVDLQQSEIYYSPSLGKKVETLGDKNTDMQVSTFGSNSQPYYFFLGADGKALLQDGYGYDPDVNKFMRVLEEAKAQYKKTL